MKEQMKNDESLAEQLMKEYNMQSDEGEKHAYSEHVHNDTGGDCCSSLCTMCLCLSCLSACCRS